MRAASTWHCASCHSGDTKTSNVSWHRHGKETDCQLLRVPRFWSCVLLASVGVLICTCMSTLLFKAMLPLIYDEAVRRGAEPNYKGSKPESSHHLILFPFGDVWKRWYSPGIAQREVPNT